MNGTLKYKMAIMTVIKYIECDQAVEIVVAVVTKRIKKLLVSEIQSILFMYSFSEKVP